MKMDLKKLKAEDISKNDGVTIFCKEGGSYDEKMDEYLRMRKSKEDERSDNKDIDIEAIEKKVDAKQEEEELRAWRRKIRIGRKKKTQNGRNTEKIGQSFKKNGKRRQKMRRKNSKRKKKEKMLNEI